ncbi:beta-adducin [Trachemys scripta elegans]|uniref:beta-adducin n=1 Tax=Trachemys scripta elegans TaxID=31138 RepID=UPI001552BCAA|nr:beta-adducin [Trachemys scripta elegans]
MAAVNLPALPHSEAPQSLHQRAHPCPPRSPQTDLPLILNTCHCSAKKTDTSQALADPTAAGEEAQPAAVVVNGKDDDQTAEDTLSKGMSQMTTTTDADPDAPKDKTESITSGPVSPEGSPSKSPSKKKKKFRTPSFLKKGKKKEKAES